MDLDSLRIAAEGHLHSGAEFGDEIAEPLEGLQLLSRARRSPLEAMVYRPVACLILRGRKQVTVGERAQSFGQGECLLVSHELPVRSQITRAPYLALVFPLKLETLRELESAVATEDEDEAAIQAVQMYRADAELIGAMGRYLELARREADHRVLGPLVSKEIHYRLLSSPFGGMLRRLLRRDSHASAIARAMRHIRRELDTPILVPELARRVGMSSSAFHKHFKRIADTTPLQYQKQLRLLEARQRLRAGAASVSDVAFEVGYESPSQFSREYTRKFGRAPSLDRGETAASSQS